VQRSQGTVAISARRTFFPLLLQSASGIVSSHYRGAHGPLAMCLAMWYFINYRELLEFCKGWGRDGEECAVRLATRN
jgi:hypothetical protein